jgi:hypothetical protein
MFSMGQRTDIVKAVHVVGVGVGYKDGVQPGHTGTNRLEPELGACVYEDNVAAVALYYD